MPEWYLLIGALAMTSLIGLLWRPLLLAVPLLGAAIALPVVQAMVAARRATFVEAQESRRRLAAATLLTALLHLMQPLARLLGRMRHGMTPWRRRRQRVKRRFAWPWRRTFSVWYETWQSSEQRLESLEGQLRERGVAVRRGGDYDRWDLELRGGLSGAARVRLTIEEHGSGKQMARYRAWPKWTMWGLVAAGACAGAAVGMGVERLWPACTVLGAVAVVLAGRAVVECGAAMGAMRGMVEQRGA
jgi:hypothetical protein